MLAALATGGPSLLAQEPAKIDPSLYIPKAHRVEDLQLLQDFMDEYSFVELVTSSPALRITHIPVLLERTSGGYGKIFGHLSRNNPQSQTFDGHNKAVVVFRGPHSYISPRWYGKKDGVPTWNFAVVHASGLPRVITGKNILHAMLAKLIDKYEKDQGLDYDFSKLPEGLVSSLMEGLVGFEMQIEQLEGKFKLGQEWSGGTQQAVLEHLRQTARQERSMPEFAPAFYRLLQQK